MFNDVAYAMGSAANSAAGQESGGAFGSPLSMNVLLMVIIFAIFYFLIIRPQHQEARRMKELLASLKKGDRVLTVGGIYGSIVEIKDDIVVLDIGSGNIEVGRKYISVVSAGKSSPNRVADRKKRPASARPSRPEAKEGQAALEESANENETGSDETEHNESGNTGDTQTKKEE